MKIKSIKKVKGPIQLVDIGVEKNHNFFANGVLTHNCNLPARNVVILGVTRGIQPVDVSDIVQMSGRSGRLGIDTEGTCHLFCPARELGTWSKKIRQSPPVESALLEESNFLFQVLAEIDIKNIQCQEDLELWFNRTLVGCQSKFNEETFMNALSKLISMGMMIVTEEELFEVTPLGKVGTSLYFKPDDVYHWFQFFKQNKSVSTDASIAAIIGNTPSMAQPYISEEYKDVVTFFLRDCQKNGVNHRTMYPFTPYAVWRHLRGEAQDQADLKFHVQNIVMDADRICSALSMVANLAGSQLSKDVVIRLKNGIPQSLAFLCDIPGIGPKKAHLMYLGGITTPEKLRNVDLSDLITCLGSSTAHNVMEYIQSRLKTGKQED